MSKASRQTSRQHRSANKQSSGQTIKDEQTLKATNRNEKPVSVGSKPAVDQPTRQSSPASRATTRQAVKYERRREEQRWREKERQRAAQRRRLTIVGVVVAAVLLLGIVGYFSYTRLVHQTPSSVVTPTPTIVNPAYPPVANISCDTLEQTANHYHAHVSLYINGQQVPIASQVGIAPDGSCFYWLHTHDTSGVIHIEAPAKRTFTLGNFFEIWGLHFSQLKYPAELDQPGGAGWQVYINGKLVSGDFHSIVLQAHMLITLAYNSPNAKPDTTFAWNGL